MQVYILVLSLPLIQALETLSSLHGHAQMTETTSLALDWPECSSSLSTVEVQTLAPVSLSKTTKIIKV